MIDKIKPLIIEHFEKAGSHDFSHTNRVYNLAVRIAENVDMDIVKAAALLHDVARLKELKDESIDHAEEGARMCVDILSKIDFPREKINQVSYAIKVHRFSKGILPNTIEAKISQDADRLDALGAICIARVFTNAGQLNKVMHDPSISSSEYKGSMKASTALNHFFEKILKITPNSFHTAKAREIANDRYNYVKEYVLRFLDEWEGK